MRQVRSIQNIIPAILINIFLPIFFIILPLPVQAATSTQKNINLDLIVYGTSTCGNAIVEFPENCDDGANNGNYGYCKNDCTGLGPHCGDGICNGAEACGTCPADCGGCANISGGGGADYTAPVIYDLTVFEIDSRSAKISWKTDDPAFCQLYWGRGTDYEGGSISENSYGQDHLTVLTSLTPSTTYHFKIQAMNPSLVPTVTADQTFTTLPLPDRTAPANVSDLTILANDKKLTLRWVNPADADLAGVIIRRSTEFFPKNQDEGTLIYEGMGEMVNNKSQFIDSGLFNSTLYFYTVFAYDASRNFSSGAIISGKTLAAVVPEVIPPKPKPGEKPKPIIPGEPTPPIAPGAGETVPAMPGAPGIIPTTTLPCGPGEICVPPAPVEQSKLLENIKFEDFEFYQGDKRLSARGARLEASSGQPLTVILKKDKVPEIAKTVLLTLVNEQTPQAPVSFLLNLDRSGQYYTATINLPSGGDSYTLQMRFLNADNQVLKAVSGALQTAGPATPSLMEKMLKYDLLSLIVFGTSVSSGIALAFYLSSLRFRP